MSILPSNDLTGAMDRVVGPYTFFYGVIEVLGVVVVGIFLNCRS